MADVNKVNMMVNFLMKFGVVESKAKKIAGDGIIGRKEVKDVVMLSPQLFELIDKGSNVNGHKPNKALSADEIELFNITINKYREASGIDDEPTVIMLYSNPTVTFVMADLDTVIKEGQEIKDGALGKKIEANTTFGEIRNMIKPEYEEALRFKFAQLLGVEAKEINGNTPITEKNIAKISSYIAFLAVASKMDMEGQKIVSGVTKPLRRIEGEINKGNILNYVKRESENTTVKPQKAVEAKEEEKKAEEKSKPQPLPETKKVKKEEIKKPNQAIKPNGNAAAGISDKDAKAIFGQYKTKLERNQPIENKAWDKELKQLAEWAKSKQEAGTDSVLGKGAYSIIKNKVIAVI
jgi:hypothetical protein